MNIFAKFRLKHAGWAVAVAVVLLAVALNVPQSSAVQANNKHIVTIYADGQERVLATNASTIGEVLERAEIPLSQQDAVEPARDSKLVAQTYNVNVYRARPVTVIDGDKRYRIMSPYQSAQKIAEAAGLQVYAEDTLQLDRIDDFVAESGVGLKLTIARSTPVNLVLYGTPVSARTQAKTVAEFLKEKQITLAEKDSLSPAAETSLSTDMAVAVYRNGTQTITEEHDIAFETEKIQDRDRDIGFREVREPGVKGRKVVTFQIELRDGKEVSRTEIQSVAIVQPKKQVEVVGAKYPMVTGPAEVLERINFWSNARGIDANRVARIAKCESGFNPLADSGYYKGIFQHDPGYWAARASKYGAAGASIFDAEAQIKVSTAMMAEGGWSHWGCK